MKALTVYLNDERICTAGLGDAGNVSADASLIRNTDDAGFVQVGGFDGSSNHHLKWCFQQLKVGDEVRIVVEETEQIDEPNERKSVEEMDRWARNLRPRAKPKEGGGDGLHPLPAPWEYRQRREGSAVAKDDGESKGSSGTGVGAGLARHGGLSYLEIPAVDAQQSAAFDYTRVARFRIYSFSGKHKGFGSLIQLHS